MDVVERHKEIDGDDDKTSATVEAGPFQSDASLSGTDQSSPASSISSRSSVSEAPSTPLAKSVKDIEAAINRLHRLAMSIRKSSTQNRHLKAADFAMLDEDGQDTSSQFESFALRIVQARFPVANPILHRRLADLILQRRKAFSYQQRHQQKLAKVVKPSTRLSIVQQPLGTYSGLQFPQSSQSSQGDGPSDPTVLLRALMRDKAVSTTTATALTVTSVLSRPAPSIVSSSADSSSLDAPGLVFPLAPKVVPSAKEFQCPYCGLMLGIKERKQRRWRYV